MFKNLRQGNPFYILHKGDKPYCEIGNVISVGNIHPKTPFPGTYPNMPIQEMVVDIKVKVGDDNVNLSSLPAELMIADYKPENSMEKLVLSCDFNAINSEINAMLQQSKQVISSIDSHKSIIENCEVILRQLNPQFAKEKEQEEEIASLKSELESIKNKLGGIDNLTSMVSSLLDQNKTTNKKTT